MGVNTVIADSVKSIPHIAAWADNAEKYFTDYDYSKLFIYNVDTVDASFLPYLAEQFDILGHKGYNLATTEAEKREIIKRAIELHRYKGTPWAIMEALRSVGFSNIIIREGIAAGYNHWAKFGIEITPNGKALDDTGLADIYAMVHEYKPARSFLVEVFRRADVADTITITNETFNVVVVDDITDVIQINSSFYYDARENYDGTRDHSNDSDVVTIT